jgi:putative copper resistance protein D
VRIPVFPNGFLAHGEEPLPPLRAGTLFHLDVDPWLAIGLLAFAIAYLYGVWRIRRRGDRWPVPRTVSFVVPRRGGNAAPIFLALGAPVTLALRTTPLRARRALTAVLHSTVARILTFPLFAYGLFVATPFALYFTGLYRVTVENDLVHALVHLHFILVGCLFFWPLLGIDPLPGRWPYPGRALLMFLSTPFHTVLGLTIMQSTVLLGGDHYPSLHLGWADPVTDQRLAGGILWAGGEIVSVTMLGVLVVQWMRHAEREGRRLDRQLDREEAANAAAAAGTMRTAVETQGS